MEICEQEEIIDPDEIYTLARVFMHELGRAVYYGERLQALTKTSTGGKAPKFHDALLADIVVLDAEWLSKAFVQVLEDEPTNAAGGLLDHSRLDVIWRTHGRPDWFVFEPQEYEYLIRLMRAFDVSIVVKGSEGKRSLVAQLVPERRPKLPWLEPTQNDGVKTVRLACALKHEAPGLMARFIVQTESYHHYGDDGRGLFWTEGVFLKDQTYGNDTLVTVDGTERPIVSITIHGSQPGWFLGEIYRTLDELLKFWPGLEKTYEVVCPKVLDDGGLCSGRFGFDFLVAEPKEHPDDNQVCQVCRSRWKPHQLLFGFDGVRQQREQQLHPTLEYFLAKQQAPCPRSFTLAPADGPWYDPRTYAKSITGQKLRLTLRSEHSGTPVISKEFTVKPGWVKWFGPLARLTALALSGVALPLTGDAAKELKEAANFMM